MQLVTLNDNTILAIGGQDGGLGTPRDFPQVYASCEIFSAISRSWTATGEMATARFFHRATLLRSGNVLVAGGYPRLTPGLLQPIASAEIFDPSAGRWSHAPDMPIALYNMEMLTLPSGLVLVTGGVTTHSENTNIYIFDEANNNGTWTEGTSLLYPNPYAPSGVLYRH